MQHPDRRLLPALRGVTRLVAISEDVAREIARIAGVLPEALHPIEREVDELISEAYEATDWSEFEDFRPPDPAGGDGLRDYLDSSLSRATRGHSLERGGLRHGPPP